MFDVKTVERFWSKVDRRGDDECWSWLAGRNYKGYGKFKLSAPRKEIRAHVFSHIIHKGVPDGLCVCHTCDNPPCVNPKHLWLGDNRANQLDCVAKGRRTPIYAAGEKNGNATLSDVEVRAIRRLIEEGVPNTHIAPIYGVTHSMVSRIKLGKSWSHLS